VGLEIHWLTIRPYKIARIKHTLLMPAPAFNLLRACICSAALWLPHPTSAAELLMTETFHPGDFKLVFDKTAAPVFVDTNDFRVVVIAAKNFIGDVERVTGWRPGFHSTVTPADRAVFIGTIGHSRVIDDLVASKKINVDAVRGQWESFLVTTVADPLPGVKSALVIAGSDRRGTAFGVFALSEAIGVSPWHWWADVPPQSHQNLVVPAGIFVQGPPAVKYRGLFINDEDYGMKPWAAQTFEPEAGFIGPKTYAQIFELLLRLRANYLWPAMHACSKPFNAFPENKILADHYAIVMGSSHCEPMLRNNVGEWPKSEAAKWNYQTNPGEVRKYWEERVRENGGYENVFTLGMRGVHDGPLQAKGSAAEKVALVEKIFADQRELLAALVNPDVTKIPQAFVPYKEVLQIYRDGLLVPEDVTLVWVDDNHGYIRELPTPAEQRRAGGSGIYYHVSYWGAPENYLWLCTTPPALIGEEMGKALAYDARTLWVLNVGDLKPAEIDIDYFLRLAREGQVVAQPEFLQQWARRNFGDEFASPIAAILGEYYLLNHAVKPEHLPAAQFDETETADRLQRFEQLRERTDRLSQTMPAKFRDAFFELVAYPVRASALANEKILCARESRRLAANQDPAANEFARRAETAYEGIQTETQIYNVEIAGGKWRYMMSDTPGNLKAGRPPEIARVTNGGGSRSAATIRAIPAGDSGKGFGELDRVVSMEAAHFTRKLQRSGASWQVVAGLGRTGRALAIFPVTAPSLTNLQEIIHGAPVLEFEFTCISTGALVATVYCVPVHRLYPGRGARLAVAVDDNQPQIVDIESEEYSKVWGVNVLRAAALGATEHAVATPGKHTFKLWMVDPGVPVDKIVLNFGRADRSYFGPPETWAQ
jgi:hypothetical protein